MTTDKRRFRTKYANLFLPRVFSFPTEELPLGTLQHGMSSKKNSKSLKAYKCIDTMLALDR